MQTRPAIVRRDVVVIWIGGVGYDEGDVPDLVEGTMKQQRLLATCPREVTEDDIAGIFRRSMSLW